MDAVQFVDSLYAERQAQRELEERAKKDENARLAEALKPITTALKQLENAGYRLKDSNGSFTLPLCSSELQVHLVWPRLARKIVLNVFYDRTTKLFRVYFQEAFDAPSCVRTNPQTFMFTNPNDVIESLLKYLVQYDGIGKSSDSTPANS